MVGVGQLQVAAGQAQVPLRQQLAQPRPAAQVADRAQVDARVAGRGHLVEDADPVGHARVVAHRDLERAVADRGVRHGYPRPRLVLRAHLAVPSPPGTAGWSTGPPFRWLSMIAWHSAMSRRPSRPEVTGEVPLTALSWNATSPDLKPVAYEAVRSVPHVRAVPPSTPSRSRTA